MCPASSSALRSTISGAEVSGKPAAGVAVFQLPGANALTVARRVKDALETLKPTFPQGLEYSIAFDTTIFVNESIREVYKTLLEAGLLVLVVILLFLQDWRAVLIPATTVPVTIIGAFAAMAALGFSINMLTMFGLILAIGIVVDDAIVIVENAVAPHRSRRPGPEDRRRSRPCRRCWALSSESRWFSWRFSFRRRSWAGSPASSTASSR